MKRRLLTNVMFVLVFFIALGVTLYPLISNHVNEKYKSEIHTAYVEIIEEADDSDLIASWEKAVEYNNAITPGTMEQGAYSQEALIAASEDYDSQLNIGGDGIMGYVEVPIVGINKSYLSKRAREESSTQIKSLLLLDRNMLTDLQAEMSTARQFVLVKRYYGLKSSVVFHEAHEIQKKIAEAGFEVRRMKKPEIKRFLAIYFGASMDGDQMPDVDGGQYVKEDTNEAVQ